MSMKYLHNILQVCVIICVLGCPAAATGDSELYMRIDDEGAYYYTDTPTSSDYIKAPSSLGFRSGAETAERYKETIRETSENTGVRPELIKAVIRVESGFNRGAVSPRGARGLMQLMPVHAREHNIDDPFDPKENILAGTRYLAQLIKRYDGNLNLSLAAYNAGPAAVDHYQGIPPYKETRQYVQKVLLHYQKYRNKNK